MSKVVDKGESKECLDDAWDDTLLIKAYDDSVNLAREELARRISLSTSKKTGAAQNGNADKLNSVALGNASSQTEHKVGDYVRATYEDGIDYEAKIMSIDDGANTCVLKYIGYENVQEVPLCDLVTSWGKKARRLQFAKAKIDADAEIDIDPRPNTSNTTTKKSKSRVNMTSIPPPPPIPPMLTAAQSAEDSEHLSAMLMSWYMSGYYTGIYQGMQMAKSTSKAKK